MHVLKFEVAGIQKYIFSSNKLKVNLGASYIIEHILFKDLLKEACKEFQNIGKLIDNWFNSESVEELEKGDNQFNIGFIGGGNALFYGDLQILNKVEINLKKLVLEYFPGIEIYSGIVQDSGTFKETSKHLNEKIKANRGLNPFLNKTFHNGFFSSCNISGDVALKWWKKEEKWVSDEVFSKICYVDINNEANLKHEIDLLGPDLSKQYSFPLEFEQFSSNNDKAYISIVHIDGNNLGNAFIESNDLKETQNLSLKVRKVGTESLKAVIKFGIIEKIVKSENEYRLGNKILNTSEGRVILPIRPIITGGDDITFICEGSLGVPLAKLLLDNFSTIGIQNIQLNEGVFACAGIAIIKQKYPFYRGYKLCEDLIKQAKEASRIKNGNYLSFMIAGYGTGTSLDDLKEKYARPDLFNNCYASDNETENSIYELEKLLKLFSEIEDSKPKVPRNKLIEIRNALVNNRIHDIWPTVRSRLKNIDNLWEPQEQKALTFDAIELVDFYNNAYLNNDKNDLLQPQN